jgi:tetratricopeptide (TPR) repeat protein
MWLTKSLEHHSDNPLALNNRGAAQFLLARYPEASADICRAIQVAPEFASAKKNRAWLRATCPAAQFRSGPEAVELATQALEMTHWDQPTWLEVLAAAHAEAGDFDTAIQWQEKAISTIGAGKDSAAGRRLGLYHSRQAFRHVCRPGEPVELIPGARQISKSDPAQNINRA